MDDEFFDYESGIFALDGEMQCPECKTDLPVQAVIAAAYFLAEII